MLILYFNVLLLVSVLLIIMISFKMVKEDYARGQTYSIFCFQNNWDKPFFLKTEGLGKQISS